MNETKLYAKLGGFQIVANHKNGEIVDFSICDINGLKLIDRSFKVASEAILYLDEVLKDENRLSTKETK